MDITQKIIQLLDNYELLEHEHVHTSKDAATVRGTRLEEAAKALVLVAKKEQPFYFMCIVSGHRKLDLKSIKKLLNVKNASLAHPDDVLKVTGCKVGTVPPFPGLLGLPGYADEAILDNEYVVFSAGSHYKSIRMKSKEWLEVSGAEKTDIGK